MIPHFTTLDMDPFAARLKEHGIPWLRQPRQESYGIEAFIEDPSVFDLTCLYELRVTMGSYSKVLFAGVGRVQSAQGST